MVKYGSLAENSLIADKMNFKFISGKYVGGEFFIRQGQRLLVGRDISSDVAIVDSKVSRNHATITAKAGRVFIEDSSSTNGTFVNGEKIPPTTPIEITDGTTISVGDSVIAVGEHNVDKEEKEDLPKANFSKTKSIKEVTSQGPNSVTTTQRTGRISPPLLEEDDDEEVLTLDAIAERAESIQNDNKVSIARVALKKGGPATTANTVPDLSLSSSKGSLSAIDPVDLLKFLSQSSSSGYLLANIVSPFRQKIEISIGATGIVSAKSISDKKFSQEKALSRFILAKDGEYEFKVDEAPRREELNRFLEDVFMEISSQRETLLRYRKIVNSDQLRFIIPMTGKLSSLSKVELDSLQSMVNTKEVLYYLNMFPDNDDFILLSEILKFIDLGILFGNGNENDLGGIVPEDILKL
ncbi:MAG: FHA domain-containing protein [bacterium]